MSEKDDALKMYNELYPLHLKVVADLEEAIRRRNEAHAMLSCMKQWRDEAQERFKTAFEEKHEAIRERDEARAEIKVLKSIVKKTCETGEEQLNNSVHYQFELHNERALSAKLLKALEDRNNHWHHFDQEEPTCTACQAVADYKKGKV